MGRTTTLGGFFEPGRAYTTQTGYLAPEEEWNFACTAVTRTPEGEPIAFGFVQSGVPEWTPTGFGTVDFTGRPWNPARPPEWLTAGGAPVPPSPLAQAEAAKAARNLVGEIDALLAADEELTSAPWYPVRPGDLVHVAYEQAGQMPAFGETYIVAEAVDTSLRPLGGLLSMEPLAHTLPDSADADGMVGCFAAVADDPLYELWFEAGPHLLTIVRDGQVVHDGAVRRVGGVAAAGLMLRTFAQAVAEAEGYLERGEPVLALARLRSPGPLPPCGAPGVLPEHGPCARPRGHGPGHSPDADFREGPHECPALPEQLHAVVTVGSKVEGVYFAGLYEDREAAVDHCSGFFGFREEHIERYVKPAPGLPGEVVLTLPAENQHAATGVQLAVVMPLQLLPDPRAEDQSAAEAIDSAFGTGDYSDDYDRGDE